MFTITIGGKKHELNDKTPILSLINKKSQKKYMAAKVNNRLRELTYELYFDANVELLGLTEPDAIKVYETSFRYLLAMAFHNVYPDYQIKISYAISRSLLVAVVEPRISMDMKMLAAIQQEIDRLVAADLPFTRMSMTKEEAYAYFVSAGQKDKADALQYRPEKTCHFYRCGDYLNYMYGYMVPSTGYLSKYKIFPYDGHIIVQYPRYEANGEIPEFKDEPTFSKVLKRAHRWATISEAEIISKINDHVKGPPQRPRGTPGPWPSAWS